jgi:hypothetical protein
LLAILLATVSLGRRGNARAGWWLCAAFLVGLGFHQSTILAPLMAALGLWFLAPGNARQRLSTVLAHLRAPAAWCLIALALGYVVYLQGFHERSYHRLVQPGAVLANVAKASLALAPEDLRVPLLEALRDGRLGPTAVAGAVIVVLWGLLAWAWWRATPAIRWLLLLIPLDLLLPVLTTGFVTRYAYLAAGLSAVAVALACAGVAPGGAGRTRWAWALALLLVWGRDQWIDVAELRDAGRLTDRLLEQADAARTALPPERTLVLIDSPDHAGRERDLPVFNWGLHIALARRGVTLPCLLLRVTPCWTSSDHQAISEAQAVEFGANPDLTCLRYSAATGSFEPWPASPMPPEPTHSDG